MNKSIYNLSFSPIARDGRVLRQIEYLSPHYDLTVLGYGSSSREWESMPGIQYREIKPTRIRHNLPSIISLSLPILLMSVLKLHGRLLQGLYDRWYWQLPAHRQALQVALEKRFDVYHANDWDALPVAAVAAKQQHSFLVWDAHEYAPLQWESHR